MADLEGAPTNWWRVCPWGLFHSFHPLAVRPSKAMAAPPGDLNKWSFGNTRRVWSSGCMTPESKSRCLQRSLVSPREGAVSIRPTEPASTTKPSAVESPLALTDLGSLWLHLPTKTQRLGCCKPRVVVLVGHRVSVGHWVSAGGRVPPKPGSLHGSGCVIGRPGDGRRRWPAPINETEGIPARTGKREWPGSFVAKRAVLSGSA